MALCGLAQALPQGGMPSGSPTDAGCTAYSTSGVPWSGSTVFIHTSLYTYPGGRFTGFGVYDSHALTRAGYDIISELHTTTSCPPTVTPGPSPTESYGCEPHGDHWHCEGPRTSESPHTSGSTPASEVPHTTSSGNNCEAHDDHWHCPPGVPEPTYPPGPPTTSSTSPAVGPTSPPGDQECEIHNDHWHCPPDVPEPSHFTTPSASEGTTSTESDGHCEAHGDHWHCPPGVAEPTQSPPSFPSSHISASTAPSPTLPTSAPVPTSTDDPVEGVCEPHGDHWHCPSGVPDPISPPSSLRGASTDASSDVVLPSGTPGGSTAPTPIVVEGSASRSALLSTSIFCFMAVALFLV
ncbi:hypothetical protein S40288_09310 [Stachybotrys chartarum IBT 40288]|nr:hypothetical protein S40288_09310 [Stachybotrys chartarum IBT 40288]